MGSTHTLTDVRITVGAETGYNTRHKISLSSNLIGVNCAGLTPVVALATAAPSPSAQARRASTGSTRVSTRRGPAKARVAPKVIERVTAQRKWPQSCPRTD